MTTHNQGIVDSLDFADVWAPGSGSGPKVTFTVPTEVADTRAAGSAIALKSLIAQARGRLAEQGASVDAADSILEPVLGLVGDSTYWRLQSRGLIVFAAEGFFRATRIPVAVEAGVTVGRDFHVLPIADVLSAGGKCFVLALSKNRVRLFDATRNSIAELDLGDIPASFDDVVQEEYQSNLQGRSAGGGTVMYHGQGDNSDVAQRQTADFIGAVAKGVDRRLGTARSQPLVLAAVAEYLPVYRSASSYPAVHDAVIPGNPEHTDPDRLRSAAWGLVADRARAEETETRERALSRVHAGKGSVDPAEIAREAAAGRVETLYLPVGGEREIDTSAKELLNSAVLAVKRGAGELRTLTHWDERTPFIATFRY